MYIRYTRKKYMEKDFSGQFMLPSWLQVGILVLILASSKLSLVAKAYSYKLNISSN